MSYELRATLLFLALKTRLGRQKSITLLNPDFTTVIERRELGRCWSQKQTNNGLARRMCSENNTWPMSWPNLFVHTELVLFLCYWHKRFSEADTALFVILCRPPRSLCLMSTLCRKCLSYPMLEPLTLKPIHTAVPNAAAGPISNNWRSRKQNDDKSTSNQRKSPNAAHEWRRGTSKIILLFKIMRSSGANRLGSRSLCKLLLISRVLVNRVPTGGDHFSSSMRTLLLQWESQFSNINVT